MDSYEEIINSTIVSKYSHYTLGELQELLKYYAGKVQECQQLMKKYELDMAAHFNSCRDLQTCISYRLNEAYDSPRADAPDSDMEESDVPLDVTDTNQREKLERSVYEKEKLNKLK